MMPILRCLARRWGENKACPSCSSCGKHLRLPLLKSLVVVSKLFLLTHFEALFLTHLFKETKWAICNPFIGSFLNKHSHQVRDLMFTHVSEDP